MPTNNRPRGKRGKRKGTPHNLEHRRPAEEQAARLNKAIARSIELTPFTAAPSDAALPAEAGDPPVPTGVTHVSLNSDSDNNLSDSDPEPSTNPYTPIITYPTPYHRVETTKHPDGRITFKSILLPPTESLETINKVEPHIPNKL